MTSLRQQDVAQSAWPDDVVDVALDGLSRKHMKQLLIEAYCRNRITGEQVSFFFYVHNLYDA